ncbi:MAG: LytTR family transcriptional regulator, partial [Atopobiaceae bacterium]|nr:LytTR family transcriptional regulator [Atopobiaceae bacterium]
AAHALRESIVLRDADGISHFLSLSDIVYIEASRQSTLVHAVTGTFRMSEGITHLLTRLDGKFVRIHRGFAVNVDHVEGMRPGYVMLDEGTSLPVPSRRTREVADDLRRAIGS